jgi:hypothetical protein
MTSLSGMFLILSVLLYTYARLEHVRQTDIRKVVLYYCAAILAGFWIAFKAKCSCFSFVFLLVEFFFIRNKEGKFIVRTDFLCLL